MLRWLAGSQVDCRERKKNREAERVIERERERNKKKLHVCDCAFAATLLWSAFREPAASIVAAIMASQGPGQEPVSPCRALSSSGSVSPSAASSAASSSQPSPKMASKVNSDIDRLLEAQKKLKLDKKNLQNELRNAQRRRKRLKHKARLLSASDLLEVMQLREDENVVKKVAKTAQREEPAALAPDEEVGSGRDDLEDPEEEAS